MIIERGSLEMHGYAVLLIADYHVEYPIEKPKETTGWVRVDLAWDNSGIDRVLQAAGATNDAANLAETHLGYLERDYNGYWDPGMSLWLVQGNLEDLDHIFRDFLYTVTYRAPSGDDDAFDYWPNALDMLIVFAKDLAELTGEVDKYQDLLWNAIHPIIDSDHWDEWEEYRKVSLR